MRAPILIALACGPFLAPLPASATGGVWCDARDANLEFHFKAVSSRDGTGGWFGIEGRLETMASGLPAGLSRFDIRDENLTERWWDGDSVQLVVQKYQNEPFASVRITLIARTKEEATYRGKYELRVTRTDGTAFEKTGTVDCSAD